MLYGFFFSLNLFYAKRENYEKNNEEKEIRDVLQKLNKMCILNSFICFRLLLQNKFLCFVVFTLFTSCFHFKIARICLQLICCFHFVFFFQCLEEVDFHLFHFFISFFFSFALLISFAHYNLLLIFRLIFILLFTSLRRQLCKCCCLLMYRKLNDGNLVVVWWITLPSIAWIRAETFAALFQSFVLRWAVSKLKL